MDGGYFVTAHTRDLRKSYDVSASVMNDARRLLVQRVATGNELSSQCFLNCCRSNVKHALQCSSNDFKAAVVTCRSGIGFSPGSVHHNPTNPPWTSMWTLNLLKDVVLC